MTNETATTSEPNSDSRSLGVLEGIVVLDFSHVVAGPFCSMILADHGATVLKVEPPHGGDPFRYGPPMVDGMSHEFATFNRGKYSIVLDLKSSEGQAAALELAKQADVVLENFRPGVMTKFGLGSETLCQANPRLIYASLSGFGQTGAWANKPALDPVVQAMAGLMALTGERAGPPLRAGGQMPMADLMSGVFAAMAIGMALFNRERTGHGQAIDAPMFDAMFFMLSNLVPFYQASGTLPERTGAMHPTVVPVGSFPTSDGHIVIAGGRPAYWKSICQALGRPEWADDERFATFDARQANRDELLARVGEATAEKTTQEWSAILDAHDVPFGPIYDIADLVDLPHVHERGLLAELGYGGLSAPINPFHLSNNDQAVRRPAPKLGEDTFAILGQMLGYTDEQIVAASGQVVAGLT